HGQFKLLESTAVALGSFPPVDKIDVDNFFVRMGGQITFREDGDYSFFIEGAAGDDAELFIGGRKILSAKNIPGTTEPSETITAKAGESVSYRLEYRHRTGGGTLRLLWEKGGMVRTEVPASALRD